MIQTLPAVVSIGQTVMWVILIVGGVGALVLYRRGQQR